MSELITEYFTCKICKENIPFEFEKEYPTTCNKCWLKLAMWERYEKTDFKSSG